MDEKLQKAAEGYLLNKRWSSEAFAEGNGGASTGHNMVAHIFLREYADALSISTDEAAKEIRRNAKP